ncbi:MAG: guanine permease [Spirochaetes bacterium GWD1_61_31]|nr:MAG: guanine permease [Spirochaetes bacterium GWB1_60_80]OHD28566.1 MAG: guanine permease [Spirochaetes bacterium GWC1_61_12]OHD39421.1 MAG: guanine permease [Spirochaetes bacterium GWD1_61_31]OHD45476.1 MAG: guanine permease [Spirochaetes bacterium GWE1_60_18]OHD58048.1 MAG: guanine permease [Spirochaetes bacterium GWF1_60_12]HAP44613.1 guanine permease [Spirochaetaceae bacterium]
MEKFFQLKAHNTNVKTEIMAGITTFMTMAYILAVNPGILSAAGMPAGGVFTATALSALIATLVMGLLANLPIALAPGMGLNAFFAFTVVLGMGYSWQLALTAVFLEGVVFILMSLFNIREAIVRAIPSNIKKATSVGIGLFIAFIGLQNAGIVVNNDATLVGLGTITSGPALVAIIGIVLTGVLLAFKVKGALLIGIIGTTIIGIPFGVTAIPEGWMPFKLPDAPLLFQFQFDKIFTLDFFVVFFTFLFVDIFDTIGTLVGVTTQAGLIKPNGDIPKVKQALLADAIGTVAGAALGTSTVTSYVESASGVAEGGRTGLTAVSTSVFFGLALFLSPVFLLVPGAATAPALILVGLFMLSPVKELDLTDFTEAIPAFITMIFMPLTYSIAEGLVFGILSYIFLKAITGKFKDISIVTWIVGAFFILKHLL